MKKRGLAVLLAALFTISGFSVSAKADGIDTSLKDQAGILPGSILYPLDKLIEKIQITFTFSDGSKAELLSNIAQERLGESQVMQDKENTEAVKETLEEADKDMDEAADKAAVAAEETKDTDSADKVTKVQNTLEKLVKVDIQFQSVLTDIQNKTPDQVKQEIEVVLKTVTDKNAARKLAVAEMVDARHTLNTARQALSQAKKSGDQAKIDEAQKTYTDALKAFQDAFSAKQLAVHKIVKGKDDTNQDDKNASNTDDQNTSTQGTATEATATQDAAAQSTGIKTTIIDSVKAAVEVKDSDKDKEHDKNKKDEHKNENGKIRSEKKGDNGNHYGNTK